MSRFVVVLCLFALTISAADTPQAREVGRVLDQWHADAAAAHEDPYFGAFAKNGVFLGTDAKERWTVDEFRRFAHPYFAKGKAWNFHAVKRSIDFSPDGNVAWFDEDLDTPNLGPARGSGVLVKEGAAWKIAQYNLTVPIPNALLPDFKTRIEAYLKEQAGKK